jgi:hypothetical protein
MQAAGEMVYLWVPDRDQHVVSDTVDRYLLVQEGEWARGFVTDKAAIAKSRSDDLALSQGMQMKGEMKSSCASGQEQMRYKADVLEIVEWSTTWSNLLPHSCKEMKHIAVCIAEHSRATGSGTWEKAIA